MDFISSSKFWAIVEMCSSKDVVLVIMIGMADELTEWGDSPSSEVGIFLKKRIQSHQVIHALLQQLELLV